MLEVSTHSVALFLHVAAAMVLVGSSLFAPLTRNAIREAGDTAALRGSLAQARRSARANPPAALVLLGTGLFLGSSGWWSQAWFWVALASWLANSALAAAVIQRLGRALGRATAAAGEGPVTGEIDRLRRSPAWDVAGDAMLANDLAILYVMLDKPGLAGALALLAAAQLALAGARLVRARRRPAAGPVALPGSAG